MHSITIAVAFAIAVTGCAPPLRPAPLPPIEPANLMSAEDYSTRVGGLRATLARNGVELDTIPVIRTCATDHGPQDKCIRCEVASRSDTANVDPEMIDGVAIAFGMYPTTMIAAAKLEHVALCRTIRYEGKESESGPPQGGPLAQGGFGPQDADRNRSAGSGPAGVAVIGDHRLLVSIEHFVGKRHDLYDFFTIEEVVHHELFHLLDHETLGERAEHDPQWQALNPRGFEYRDPSTAQDRPRGFVDGYATTNETEDRASVFEFLLGHPTKLCELAQADPVVAAKTAVVWERVARIVGDPFLHSHAPCVGWLRSSTMLPKQLGPAPPEGPARRSILGKMR
ncbi:MAG: hypothetical protein H6Q90_459 [Deltaproteobacteria bacterium]|nr:hypothetical protein [Deltaproteobacteria bacterium]